jgi:SAM-dependent methyltransferase
VGLTKPPAFPPEAFERQDEEPDARFYASPRLVTHIDDAAIAALSACYADLLPASGVWFDLMSSWVSHLPAHVPAKEVVGHGMNAAELRANPRLTRWFVQDLNCHTAFQLENGSCDAAMCAVSVQYLQRPLEVFEEVRRALRPGRPFIVSYSNRCFPTKAVAIWRSLGTRERASLIHLYMSGTGFTDIEVRVLANGMSGDPLIAVIGRA